MPYFINKTEALITQTSVSGTDAGTVTRPIEQATSSSLSQILAFTTLQQILPENAARLGASFYISTKDNNEFYLQLGVGPTGSFTITMKDESYYELSKPIYTGVIQGRFKSAVTGSLLITEFV